MINKRNFGLDIVRSFAISLVLFNHIFSNTFKIDMGIWWYLAYLGVDIFFALSGFLIGTILIRICESNNGTLPLTQTKLFLIRRWFRTVPLYIIMLLINFIFSKYVFKSIDVFNWKYLFWLQNFDTPPPKFFGESWTLCIEEWFYFSFSAGLCLFTLLIQKWKLDLKYKILIFTLAYILFFTFLRIQFSNFDLTELNITIFRLDSVAYGVLISLLHNLFKFRIKKYWLVILGAGFSLLGILLFLSHEKVGNFYMLYYSFTGFGLALCVLFLKLCYDWLRPLFNGKAISFIAKISYSLYLVNLIVIYSFISFFNAYINNFLLAFLILSFTTLFSYLTYNCIEKTFLILRDKYYPSSQQIKKNKLY